MTQTIDEIYPILKFFEYKHLPTNLQEVSMAFRTLAYDVAVHLPYCDETIMGLRKLLEAKDCIVRARLEDNR